MSCGESHRCYRIRLPAARESFHHDHGGTGVLAVQVERKGASSRGILYCDVSVNVTTGCPSPYGPSAVTCTAPALAGKVSTTEATPEVFVVTSRLDSVPESVVKNMSAPAPEVPPDFPGAKVTERVRFVPGAPL